MMRDIREITVSSPYKDTPIVTPHSGDTLTVTPHFGEDTPIVTPHSGEDTPIVTPHSGEDTPIVTPHSGEDIPIVTPHSGEDIPIVTPHSGEDTPIVTPHSGEDTPIVTPHSGEDTPIVTPHSGDTPIVTPHSGESVSTPSRSCTNETFARSCQKISEKKEKQIVLPYIFLEETSDLGMIHTIMGLLNVETISPIIQSRLINPFNRHSLKMQPHNWKPILKPQLVVESINLQPIVKLRRNPRQSISSLSPSQQYSEKISEKEIIWDKPRSLKKVRLWNLLSIGE